MAGPGSRILCPPGISSLAASTLGKLPKTDSHALEAQFYRGLALFYIGNYVKAEDAFAFVATMLPLPEVVNNQGSGRQQARS